jgi:2-oxoisovalerate dehydrogenase E1 component alpha subunit
MSDIPFAILNQDGSCPDVYRGLIEDQVLASVLETMVLNRVMDRRFLMLQRQGRLGFYMTSTGEEATTIGASYCLVPEDAIFLSYRELGSLLWRGISLERVLNQCIGNSRDLCRGRQMPLHYCYQDSNIPSVSSPVGTQLPHACGFAYAAKLRNTQQVALAFLGEGTASQGDFHTAVNFSGVFKVPAVFVIRNNGYAISTPESVQTAAASLASRGQGYGVPGFQVDGNDFLAVVNVVGQAVERARSGEGPTLIEAMTYRMGAHSTADDPSVYRSDDETRRWQELDPLVRLGNHGCWRGIWSEEIESQVRASCEERITALITECEQWPPPELETLFEEVTHEMSPQLEEQREEYLRFWNSRKIELHDVP